MHEYTTQFCKEVHEYTAQVFVSIDNLDHRTSHVDAWDHLHEAKVNKYIKDFKNKYIKDFKRQEK